MMGEVRRRYESLVPATDFAEPTEVTKTGNLAQVQEYTAEHAPHSFLNFWTLDPTPMMRLGRSWHPGGGSRLRADPSRRPTPSPFCQGGSAPTELMPTRFHDIHDVDNGHIPAYCQSNHRSHMTGPTREGNSND
jgi:hypothetical protein